MTRPPRLLAAVAFSALAALVRAQSPPPSPGASLEEVRAWATEKVRAQEGPYRELLDRASPMLRATQVGVELPAMKDILNQLAERAGVFPDLVIERMIKDKSENLRRHLTTVLILADDPSIGAVLLARSRGVDDATSALLVQAAGRTRSPAIVDDLAALVATPPSPAVMAEAIVAMARCNAPTAAAVARAQLEHTNPLVRRAAVEALGLVGGGHADSAVLRRLAGPGGDAETRLAALRALGHFKGDMDALRTLHEALSLSDAGVPAAALDALENAANKDLSPKFILQVVKTGPVDQRERAARLMMRLGSPDGVKHLLQKERAEADRLTEKADVQIGLGDRYKDLGWYEGAILLYDRALGARPTPAQANPTQVSLARCYARLRRFDDSKKKLRAAGLVSFRAFADDADFAEMRDQPQYRDLFK